MTEERTSLRDFSKLKFYLTREDKDYVLVYNNNSNLWIFESGKDENDYVPSTVPSYRITHRDCVFIEDQPYKLNKIENIEYADQMFRDVIEVLSKCEHPIIITIKDKWVLKDTDEIYYSATRGVFEIFAKDGDYAEIVEIMQPTNLHNVKGIL